MEILVLRNKNFGLLWIAQVMSQAGSRMFQLAIVWWAVSQKSEASGLFIALFLIASVLPSILFSKQIGAILGKHHPRRILLASDLLGTIASIALGTLFYLDRLSPEGVIGFGLVFAACQAFTAPTLQKSAQDVVSPADLERATTFLSSTQSLASFGGAVLGTVLIEQAGPLAIILLNGASYLFALSCEWKVDFPYSKPKAVSSTGAGEVEGGYQIPRTISLVLLGFGVVNFFLSPLLMLIPIYVSRVLDGSASILASMEAFVWLGLLGGTFGAKALGMKDRTLLFVAICLLTISAFLCVPGLFPDLLRSAPVVYGVCLFTASFALGLLNVRILTLFQRAVPAESKGPFFARMQAVVSTTLPLSYFCFGIASDYLPVTTLCLLQAGGIFVMGLVYHRFGDVPDAQAGHEVETALLVPEEA